MTQASKQQRDILVTSALPYANGPIHLGHLLEYIQTDIWVRYQNMRGHNCYYVCADDAHGTAIMLRAEREGITPEELIDRIRQEHQEDFAGFHIRFDNYYSTHSEENQYFSEYIYRQIQENGNIATRKITQFFDPEKEMFLADRFIKGTCPKCKTDDQYGDNCEACGATYPGGADQPALCSLRRHAGGERIRALFLQAAGVPRLPEQVDPQWCPAAAGGQQAGRVAGCRPAGVGHQP